MSIENENNGELMCRACLKTSEACGLNNLFLKENNFIEFQTISELFSTYTFLKVDDDGDECMPYICNECYQFLVNFHVFRKMCVTSSYELLKLKFSISDCSVQLSRTNDLDAMQSFDKAKFVRSNENSRAGVSDSSVSRFSGINTEAFDGNVQVESVAASNFQNEKLTKKQMLGSSPEKNNFTCPICGLKVSANYILNRHMNLHTREKQYQCEFCSAVFYQASGAFHHRKLTHFCSKQKDLYYCYLCRKLIGNRGEYVSHAETLHAEKFLKCKICFQVCKNLDVLNTHRVLHKKENEPNLDSRAQDGFVDLDDESVSLSKVVAGAKCQICGVIKRTNDLLMQHMNIYHRKQYFCEFCATICVGSDSMDSHRYQAHHIKKVDDIYSCGLCNENFLYSDDINQHMSEHSSDEQETLDTKNLTDSLQTISDQPIVNVSDEDDTEIVYDEFNEAIGYSKTKEYLKCEICKAPMASKRVLKLHMNIHTKKKRFPCEFCSRVYFSWTSCHSHRIRKHHIIKRENVYRCDLCEMHFVDANDVKQHFVMHAGELGEDDAEMSTSRDLDSQQQTAANKQPESMSEDENGAIEEVSNESNEIPAFQMNVPEKQFICEFCSRVYFCFTSLHSHRIRTHHVKKKNNVYICTFCQEIFLESSEMKDHVIMHTGHQPEPESSNYANSEPHQPTFEENRIDLDNCQFDYIKMEF